MQFATKTSVILDHEASNATRSPQHADLNQKDPAMVDVFAFDLKTLGVGEDHPFIPQRAQTPTTTPQVEKETDSSSTDSFPLVESTEAPSSFNSHFSSSSSLSGFFKSPKSSTSNGKKTKSEGSGSFIFSRGKNSQSHKKAYVKLQSQCNKFKNQNNAGKANYLRLTLLPFLRNNAFENSLVPSNSQIELALKVFAAWWRECLEVMKSNFKNVAGVDKDAFYEAVSSLMARSEWLDHQEKPVYQNLLSSTLVHFLTKCSTAVYLPISLAAVTGKCLAYSFLYIPYTAVYLLNLLEISQSTINRLGSVDIEQKIVKSSTLNTQAQGTATATQGTPRSTTGSSGHKLGAAASITSFIPPLPHFHHPPYLQGLVDAHEKPSTSNLHTHMSWFPFETCKNWHRYFVVDSPLFVSFFKHLCVLQTQSLPISYNRDGVEFGDETKLFAVHGEATILNAPGMRLIFASVVTHLDKIAADSGRSISPRNSNPYDMRNSSNHSTPGSESPNRKAGRTKLMKSDSMGNLSSDLFSVNAVAQGVAGPASPQRFRADQLKVFTAMREILHSDESTVPYVLAYSRIFDRLLRAFAMNIRAHDVDGCVIACDLAEEWMYSVTAVKSTKACTAIVTFKSLTMDWEFWLMVIKRMMNTDNIHTEIRALSFLYNVWPYLPNNDLGPQQKDGKMMISSLVEWLLTEEVWLKFFCHWSPLVRSYYHRLVCYRVASVGVDSGSWILDVESAQCIAESRQLLQYNLAKTYLWCQVLSENTKMKPEVVPSLPMPRMRVGVRQVGPTAPNQGKKVETNVSRVYPFDVFDTAAYWQRDTNGAQFEEDTVAAFRIAAKVPTPDPPSSNNEGTPPAAPQTPPQNASKRPMSRISSSPQLFLSPHHSRSSLAASSSETIGEVSPSDEYPNDSKPSTALPEQSTSLGAPNDRGENTDSNNITGSDTIGKTTTSPEHANNANHILRSSPSTASLSSRISVSPLRLRRKDKKFSSSPNIRKDDTPETKNRRNSFQRSWTNIRKLITGKDSNDSKAAPEESVREQADSKDVSAVSTERHDKSANTPEAVANNSDPNGNAAFAIYTSSSSSSSQSSEKKKELKAPFLYREGSTEKSHSYKSSTKTDNKSYINATPAELTKPRPEIVRPPHRFVMIPTNARPPVMNMVQKPKLPFTHKVCIDPLSFDCQSRRQDRDLAIWNYGGRSLAEWNIEVSCFEGFIRLQEKTYSETLEMFNMPFLVAEIPWRSFG